MKQVLKWYISCNRLWIHFCWENLLLLFDNIYSYILVPNSWGLSWRGNLQCRAMNSTIEWWKVPKFEERWCCDCCSAPFDWWQLSIKEWGRRRQGAHILWLRKGGAPQPEGQEEKAGAGRGVGGGLVGWLEGPEETRGSQGVTCTSKPPLLAAIPRQAEHYSFQFSGRQNKPTF